MFSVHGKGGRGVFFRTESGKSRGKLSEFELKRFDTFGLWQICDRGSQGFPVSRRLPWKSRVTQTKKIELLRVRKGWCEVSERTLLRVRVLRMLKRVRHTPHTYLDVST
jgi:hypothetical protein